VRHALEWQVCWVKQALPRNLTPSRPSRLFASAHRRHGRLTAQGESELAQLQLRQCYIGDEKRTDESKKKKRMEDLGIEPKTFSSHRQCE